MIGSVYDYYLTTYAGKPLTKSDTHKRSELRNIYNDIVKISKSSPLYKIVVSSDLQKYVIDLKENARSLSNNIDTLLFDSSLQNNSEYSSDNDDIISVKTLYGSPDLKYAHESSENELYPSSDNLSFEVRKLAAPQINTGFYLRDDALNIPSGNHTFEVSVNDNTYEFQFRVNNDDNNKSVLEKLSRLINRSAIGLNSNVLRLGGTSALEISSTATGTGFGGQIFRVSDSSENDIVTTLGIGNVTSDPSNADFTLNGIEKTSSNNTFTINKSMEITLKDCTPDGESVNITKKNTLDSVSDAIHNLAQNYNTLIVLSKNNISGHGNVTRLNKELIQTSHLYKNDLESIGFTFSNDGFLQFDESLFMQAANEEPLEDVLNKLTDFKNALSAKSRDIIIDPMKYVNKTMISYPHPMKEKNFANPYVTSIYSGMMFNGYV